MPVYLLILMFCTSVRSDLLKGKLNRLMLHLQRAQEFRFHAEHTWNSFFLLLFIQVWMTSAQEVKRAVYKSQGLWFDPRLPPSTFWQIRNPGFSKSTFQISSLMGLRHEGHLVHDKSNMQIFQAGMGGCWVSHHMETSAPHKRGAAGGRTTRPTYDLIPGNSSK